MNGLCFRCEHRAKYLESASRPRYECGDVQSAKYACYMYKPVLPVVLAPVNKGDKRPRFAGSMLSQREETVRVADGKLKAKKLNGEEVVLYWTYLK